MPRWCRFRATTASSAEAANLHAEIMAWADEQGAAGCVRVSQHGRVLDVLAMTDVSDLFAAEWDQFALLDATDL